MGRALVDHGTCLVMPRRITRFSAVPETTFDEVTMGKVYEQLDASLIGFIERQHVFFVGTAPDAPDGHLNVSPKGLDTFRILGPNSVAYLDLTGSGIETVAHIAAERTDHDPVLRLRGPPAHPAALRQGASRRARRCGLGPIDRGVPRVSGDPLIGRDGLGADRRLVRVRRSPLRVQRRAVPVDRVRQQQGA